jgi:hypothetical protein
LSLIAPATFGVSDGGHLIGSAVKPRTIVDSYPENRRWDVDDRERIAQAIELYDVMPSDSIDAANERWLKRRAREYCSDGKLTLTADPD